MKVNFVELCGFRGFRERVRFDLPTGFAVVAGRNGSGKSTLLDAIDFAVTGTLNKFSVREARGGGLDEHIWWVGEGRAEAHYVSVGFVDENGDPFVITHSRGSGSNHTPTEISERMCEDNTAVTPETIMQTTLIRDELIAGLSLDLPEQARFAAVRAAIGGVVGPDYSGRTTEILNAATAARNAQQTRVQQSQDELGRALSALTEARSTAERSTNVSEALRMIEALGVSLPGGLAERIEVVRGLIVQKRTEFQEIEGARLRAVAILAELTFFNSESGHAEVAAAVVAVENAARVSELAEQNLSNAILLDAAEREGDQYSAHLAVLLEHGTAIGLHEGHCPLCDAARTSDEFERAVAATRTRIAARGERLAASARAVAQARSAASAASDALILAERKHDELEKRQKSLEDERSAIRDIYLRHNFEGPVEEPETAAAMLVEEQQQLVQLERALLILEGSSAIDRVTTLAGC